MDRFYIITNDAKDRDFKLTEEIETYLTSHGKECRVQQAERRQRGKFHYTDPDLIPVFLYWAETEPFFRRREMWSTERSRFWE